MIEDVYDVGESPRVSKDFEVDPTTVTFKFKPPTGTVTTYIYGTDAQIVRDSYGKYHVDMDLTVAGIVYWRWESTGPPIASEGAVLVKTSQFS